MLRRLDCVLEPTKAAVLAKAEELKGTSLRAASERGELNRPAGRQSVQPNAPSRQTVPSKICPGILKSIRRRF